jgi:hypothetical protein
VKDWRIKTTVFERLAYVFSLDYRKLILNDWPPLNPYFELGHQQEQEQQQQPASNSRWSPLRSKQGQIKTPPFEGNRLRSLGMPRAVCTFARPGTKD